MVRANHRNCLNFRSEFKELIYPILVQNGHGGRFVDVDGNTYVDLAMGFGASFFGHEPEFVVEAVRRELTEGQGMLIGPCTPHAEEVARLVAELTGVERVAFYNTGTQAVMLALRLARAATGRTKVAVFTGAFHGIYDGTLVRPDYLADGPEAAPGVPGVTEGSVRDVLIVDYGDPAALDVLRPHAHELAAVLVEPVQSRNPDLQPRRFLHALREFASAAGAALIFDETITGFRLHPGGAQALFGVPADIVTFGKVAGGGMPIGIVAGRAFYLDGVDGGVWSYGDDSFPPNDERRTFLGGTFCEHPLAMVAAAAALRHVRDHSPALQDGVNRRMTDLVARLDALFAAEQVPITTEHCGSMLRLVVPRDLELIWYHLLDEGVYTWEGRTLFLSTAHTDADVDHVVEAFARGIAELRSGGFLPERPGGPDQLALTDEQRQMWFAATAGQAAVDSVLVRLRGELDSDALVRAFHRLVNRHEALRTGLSGDGEHQLVYPAVTVDVPVLDWSDVPDADARLVEWARERTAEPFDLARPPLLRAWLIRRGGDDHELVLLGHHLVVDGWSWTVLVEEFAALYAGRTLPAAPRFRDFLRRRAAVLDGPHGVAAREHWRRVLADPPAPLRLGDSGRGGGRVSTVVDAKLYPRLIEVARARHCTVPMVLFAGLQLLLNQITGRTDLVVGLPTAGQLATGATGLVGNCANVLPIRVTLGDGSIADLLGTVRATVSDAYQHQAVSIAGLVAHQGPGGEPELVPPDLSVVCNVDKSVALSVTGLRVDARPGPMGAARAELFVNAVVDEGTLRLDFDAAPTITRSTCETWLRAYTELLAAIADDPDRALARLPRVVERFDPIEDAFGSGQPSDAEHVAPRSDAERRVARVWAELFELPEPSVHTSFFELGGTSLIATRLVSRLARAFQRPVPLRAVFDAPTVAKLAEFLTAEAPVADPASVVVAGDRDHGEFPLSLAQRRLWYLEQLGTGTSYTVFVAVRMHGQLDRGVLTACVREVVRRHAALRTTFREVDGEATQLIAPPDEVAVEVPLTDLSTAEDPAGAVRRELRAELDRPFDIGAGPLLRTRLLRLADDEHVMAVSMHHIVSDGWSLDVLLREVLVLYEAFGNGQPSPLPKLPVQYPDFAVWQQDWLNSEEFVRQLDYWRERLAGLAPLELPIDRPRPLTPDFAGRIHRFTLPGSVSDEVRRFSQAEQVSLLTTLLAAFQALLHAVCGQDDIAVGTPSANRNHLETEGLIGFFLNMLVIRTDVGGRPTFRELVGQVRDRVLGADANQAVPFDLLVDELGAVRDAAHSPLFNVMFLLDTSNSRWQAGGLELTRVDYEWHTSKFDLSLLVDDVDGELRCVFEYRTDLFDHDTIELLANRFETFVGKVTANPEARL
jgi:iturin family lipopeptide synthetase A